MAANELSHSYNIIMLEALPHSGGRIQSITQNGDIVEGGAEFAHGNVPVTLGLLKEAGIKYVKATGSMYRRKKGQFIKVEEMTEGWESLLQKMKNCKEDITMQYLLDSNYNAAHFEPLRKHVKSYVEGFDLADLARVSVKALYKEWEAEEEDIYRIPSGYSSLIDYLQGKVEACGHRIYNNTIVKRVQWQTRNVTVFAANGAAYKADKLLVTVPVSVLQQPFLRASIQFDPPVHFNEQTASDIGFGTVVKVVLKFKEWFWPPDAGFILSDEYFPTWWTRLPDKTPILTGWLGEPGAAAISGESDEKILEEALASLSALYDKPVVQLRELLEWSKVYNWHDNEFAMGAYSYSTIQTLAAQQIISAPVNDTLFFAGEALYTGNHPGTVEAAFVNGIETANLIKTTL